MPLKTYLPDGDIDVALVQVSGPSIRDSWAPRLAAALEAASAESISGAAAEAAAAAAAVVSNNNGGGSGSPPPQQQRSPPAPAFPVRDVTIVHAEVRLLKCLIRDAVVDVSFESLGGLRAAAALEAADRAVGRSHLFKRSVLLIKAWCFYEGRVLGAQHGLLSTYALETMVLRVLAGGGGNSGGNGGGGQAGAEERAATDNGGGGTPPRPPPPPPTRHPPIESDPALFPPW